MKKNGAGAQGPGAGKRTRPEAAIVSIAGIDLEFESGRKSLSPYRALLEKLMDAPKESALKVGRIGARASIQVQAKKLGYKLAYAEAEGCLYVRIVGYLDKDTAPSATASGGQAKASCPTNGHGPRAMILASLSQGPMTVRELARVLGVTSQSCNPTIGELVKSGSVECEDGIYRIPAVRKGAA